MTGEHAYTQAIVEGDRTDQFSILLCGDCAVSVELGTTIDTIVNDRVMALEAALLRLDLAIVDTTPTYRALLIEYDPDGLSLDGLRAAIAVSLRTIEPEPRIGPLWEIPVVYGGQFGEDLHDLAERHAMSTEALVALHLAPDYRVGMVGFVPGFSYLIGLDPKIATPRRASPRVSVPAGSIAIGGAQTAVGSLEAPSGWHQIGRTPVHAFRSDRTSPSLLAPGDRVRFRQIQEADWHALALAAYRGDTVARRLE